MEHLDFIIIGGSGLLSKRDVLPEEVSSPFLKYKAPTGSVLRGPFIGCIRLGTCSSRLAVYWMIVK